MIIVPGTIHFRLNCQRFTTASSQNQLSSAGQACVRGGRGGRRQGLRSHQHRQDHDAYTPFENYAPPFPSLLRPDGWKERCLIFRPPPIFIFRFSSLSQKAQQIRYSPLRLFCDILVQKARQLLLPHTTQDSSQSRRNAQRPGFLDSGEKSRDTEQRKRLREDLDELFPKPPFSSCGPYLACVCWRKSARKCISGGVVPCVSRGTAPWFVQKVAK